MPEFAQKINRPQSACVSSSLNTKYSNQKFEHTTIIASPEQQQGGNPGPVSTPPAGEVLPFTAHLLEARSHTESCRVPQGQHGSSKVARYRIFDFNGRPLRRSVTVSERFTKIEGPDNVFRRLTPASRNSDARGFFNDCYRIYQSGPFPSDFRLKVEQNHLIGSEIISKNHITFTPNSLLLCVFERSSHQRDFNSRCRNF